jgi:hypothetical protein
MGTLLPVCVHASGGMYGIYERCAHCVSGRGCGYQLNAEVPSATPCSRIDVAGTPAPCHLFAKPQAPINNNNHNKLSSTCNIVQHGMCPTLLHPLGGPRVHTQQPRAHCTRAAAALQLRCSPTEGANARLPTTHTHAHTRIMQVSNVGGVPSHFCTCSNQVKLDGPNHVNQGPAD